MDPVPSSPASPARTPRSARLSERWAVAGPAPWILLLALMLALVRFARLDTFGLWLDEALTWADSNHALAGGMGNPLGYLLIGWTVRLLGGEPTEFSLRLAPALVGWLCVPLTYWALRAVAGRERAAVAALLVAVSAWHVYWSTSARFYTFAQATTLVGAGIWLRGLFGARTLPALLGLAIVAAATLFHPTSAFLLAALVLAPFAPRLVGARLEAGAERVALRILLVGAACGLAAASWGWGWIQSHAAQKPFAEPLHLALTAGYHFTPLLLAAALVGALGALRRREPFAILAGAVPLVGFGLALALSLVGQMTAQYVFVLLPWVALLAALVATSPDGVVPPATRASSPRVSWVVVALLALPALADTALLSTQRHGERARWREAYEYVAERRQPGDLILGHASKLGEFYLGQGSTNLRQPLRVSPLNLYFTQAPRHWNRHGRRVWVVYRPQWLAELTPEDQVAVQRWLREELHLVERFEVQAAGRDLDLEIYLRP